MAKIYFYKPFILPLKAEDETIILLKIRLIKKFIENSNLLNKEMIEINKERSIQYLSNSYSKNRIEKIFNEQLK